MLTSRIIAAVILAGIIVPTLIWGGPTGIFLLVTGFILLGVWELVSHLPGLSNNVSKIVTMLLSILVPFLFLKCSPSGIPAIVVFLPLVIISIHLFIFTTIENTLESTSQMILTCVYVTVPLAHVISISCMGSGYLWIIFTLLVVCLGDAGAYFGGRSFGRHHFSSNVSPSKTVEGLVGGLIGNLLGMVIMKVVVSNFPPLWDLLQLTIILAIVAPIGDLCASALKRRLAIKDFGSVIPGHGGVLDRADSLIPSFPVVFYFLSLSGYGTF
ncbi:MAG: CDP-archaeol synthase [Desulfomonile sp.]